MPADPNQGIPTNVQATPITTDSRGRRVRAKDGGLDAFPQVADQRLDGLMARVAALEAQLAGYIALNDGRKITGGGAFSGTLGTGLMFNPANIAVNGTAACNGDGTVTLNVSIG